ncbi:hypothetical protein E4U42_003862 [Claviceps africana]|uniref:Uncharacterized protein n=1 Tax=Claviceps africana TaxID=83212 RepID=A0A8K0JI28_9HYPO|nr:hypothetical protein E4U42_003862 [Claviceps africana]
MLAQFKACLAVRISVTATRPRRRTERPSSDDNTKHGITRAWARCTSKRPLSSSLSPPPPPPPPPSSSVACGSRCAPRSPAYVSNGMTLTVFAETASDDPVRV